MRNYLITFIFILTLSAPQAFAATPVTKEEAVKSANTVFQVIEKFRADTYTKIIIAKEATQKDLIAMEKASVLGSKPLDATEKPITYVKFFLLMLAGYIFATQVVFYGLALLVAFFVLRFLYRLLLKR